MEIYKEVPEKFHNQFMETVAILEQKKPRKRAGRRSIRRMLPLAAVALVAIILGTLTVSTNAEALEKVMAIVEKIVIKEPLAEKMHVETEREEENIIVEEISDGEKTSVQQGEVAVCVEQVISDGEDAYIYLSVELPKHLEVERWKTGEDRLYFRQNEIRINNSAPERVNFTLKHLEENQAYGIVYISLEKVEEGNCHISLTLNNLDYAVFAGEEKGWDTQRLVEETWELNWSFSCEKMAISYKAEANIDAHDGTVITKEAVVSPLSVRITGNIECDDPTYSQVSCYIDRVILKDGILEEYDANYRQIEEETKKYNMKWYFKHMIPMEDVIGVVVNGEYIYFN